VLRAAQRELATRAPSTGANPQHRAACHQQTQPDIEAEHWGHLKTSNPIWVFSLPHQLALPEREMAGWWWLGPDSESDCCCSMDAFELEVSGAVTGREAGDGLA
jgi:hypothetical protein